MEEWLGVVVYFPWAVGKSMNGTFIYKLCLISFLVYFENYTTG